MVIMPKIIAFLKNNFFVLLLLLLAVIVAYRNYVPNTFLTGWDTLHPEFDYKEYWSRIIGGAWQEHQGLGAVNTQAHASEIPRILLLMFIDIFLKTPDVRYAYALLMLILGPLGVYFYVKKVFLSDLHSKASSFGAFCAGLFYLLNLGTLQHFYVPLEMFLTHYGFLGWTFLYSTLFFENPTKKNYISFIIVNLLITSQAHTPTLFYVYFLSICLYFGALTIVEITKKHTFLANLKKASTIILTVLILNFFWLLPSTYFLVTRSQEIQQSKIHHLFSEEAFLANVKFGTLPNIALVKGFLFDWGEYIGGGEFGQLLNEWNVYYANTDFLYIGYVFFVLILFGIILSIFRKHPYWLSIVILLFVSTVFLLSINPPFGFILSFLLSKFPILKEALRFPFTKFSILLMFCYSVFFGSFWGFFSSVFDKVSKHTNVGRYIYLLCTFFVILSFYLYMRPAFYGNLLSKSMKINIPSRYFEMFDYINTQDGYGRVADLPLHSFWGWVYYSWNDITKLGYQGAGFLWFGINRPLLDREFDRWNLSNEQAYRELSYAVYMQDITLVENTLEKYKIRWLLLDESVFAPGYSETVLFIPETEELLSKSSRISLAKDFGSGLFVYEYRPVKEFSLHEYNVPYSVVGQKFFREYKDYFYNTFGTYIYGANDNFSLIGVNGTDEEITNNAIYSDESTIYFGANNVLSNKEVSFQMGFLNKSIVEPYGDEVVFSFDKEFYSKKELPNVFIDFGKNKSLDVFRIGDLVDIDIYPVLEACSIAMPNASYSVERLATGFTLKARNIRACVTSKLSAFPQLSKRDSNLFTLMGDALRNRDICIYDTESALCKNFSLNGQIYAYLDKPIDVYSIRITSDSSATPFEKVNTFSNLKAGWLQQYPSIYLGSSTNNFSGTNIILAKDTRYSSFVDDLSNDPRLCDFSSGNLGDSLVTYTSESIIYTSKKQSLCDSFYFHNLDQSKGYILEIRSKNTQGVPMRVCLTNEVTKRCDAYFALPANDTLKSSYYMLPPFGDSYGYTLNISNTVFGGFPTSNELSYISFTPINYDFMKGLHGGQLSTAKKGTNLFIYNESYDTGWLAICGGELCNAKHVVVNNWANGWVFNEDMPDDIRVIFWPQYLEYLGFILLLVPLLRIIKVGRK